MIIIFVSSDRHSVASDYLCKTCIANLQCILSVLVPLVLIVDHIGWREDTASSYSSGKPEPVCSTQTVDSWPVYNFAWEKWDILGFSFSCAHSTAWHPWHNDLSTINEVPSDIFLILFCFPNYPMRISSNISCPSAFTQTIGISFSTYTFYLHWTSLKIILLKLHQEFVHSFKFPFFDIYV